MIHEDLVGKLDHGGEAWNAMLQAQVSPDAARSLLDGMVQGQSVMVATNQILAMVVLAFVVAASAIWFAPRPTRTVDLSQAGH